MISPPEPAAAEHSTTRSARTVRAGLAVALLSVAPLLPGLRAAFLYDDTSIIRDNGWLRGWSALLHVWTQPYWPTTGADSLGLYRPMHVALLAAVWNLGGGSSLLFHLYALALAAAVALAVWWLLRRGINDTAALMAALWFATHPLHVEAVASVANTSELLVVLGTVLLARLLMRSDEPTGSARPWRRAAAIALVAAATLLSKESGLLALAVALLTAWGWSGAAPSWRAVVRANRRGLVLSAGALAVALIARRLVLGAAVSRVSIAAAGVSLSAAERVPTMLSLWPRIARSIALPSRLAPYYGPTIMPSHRAALAIASALGVIVLVALAIILARRGDRRPLVALGWIALTYFPASNLLVATGQVLSDRNLFGATVGATLALAWALDVMPPRAHRYAIGLAALLVLHGAFVSLRYAAVWTSHRALWSRLIEDQPAEHLGYKLLGMDARARGNHAEAIALLGRARAMAPADRQIRFEHGQALYDAGRFESATEALGTMLGDEDALSEPGFVRLYLDAVGRARGAQAVVDAARPLLETDAGATAALYTGIAYQRLGRPAAADSAFAAGLRAAPGDTALAARLRGR